MVMTTNADDKARGRSTLPKAAMAAGIASCLAMGGVMAYLTATDTAVNKFELADGSAYATSITVEEPSWDTTDENANGIPDAAEGFLPGQEIAKDPQVKNGSAIDSYVMVTVEVPTESVQVTGAESATLSELFTYEVNEGWTEQGSGTYSAEAGTTTHTYLYSSKLLAGATTPSVFDTVELIDLASGQIGAGELAKDITVTSHAIQALGFDDADAAYAALSNQSA